MVMKLLLYYKNLLKW